MASPIVTIVAAIPKTPAAIPALVAPMNSAGLGATDDVAHWVSCLNVDMIVNSAKMPGSGEKNANNKAALRDFDATTRKAPTRIRIRPTAMTATGELRARNEKLDNC